MTTGIFGLNESVTAAFLWEDADGAPLTALSPAPTVAVTNPNGVVTAPSLTQRGSTGYWDVTITPDVVGLWAIQARCTDPDCAAEYTDPVPLWVTTESLTDMMTTLDAVEAQTAQIGSGIVIVQSSVDTNGDVFLYRGKTQTLTWASDSGLDLNASGRTVRYQFGTTSLLCTVTGSVADWVISVTYLVPTTLAPGKYESELALYENAVEHEPLGLLTTTVRRNPGLENQ